jgi:hypothetical protein
MDLISMPISVLDRGRSIDQILEQAETLLHTQKQERR